MDKEFEETPILNQEFIDCNPTDRIFAVTESEQLYVQVYNSVKATRKLPYYGNPRL